HNYGGLDGGSVSHVDHGVSTGNGDFMAVKLSAATGAELWRWQGGSSRDDSVLSAYPAGRLPQLILKSRASSEGDDNHSNGTSSNQGPGV
ncbi:unnamed protein product, partial [Discosporangium mesarthrocarpum]